MSSPYRIIGGTGNVFAFGAGMVLCCEAYCHRGERRSVAVLAMRTTSKHRIVATWADAALNCAALGVAFASMLFLTLWFLVLL